MTHPLVQGFVDVAALHVTKPLVVLSALAAGAALPRAWGMIAAGLTGVVFFVLYVIGGSGVMALFGWKFIVWLAVLALFMIGYSLVWGAVGQALRRAVVRHMQGKAE